jgi:hypothetical protein
MVKAACLVEGRGLFSGGDWDYDRLRCWDWQDTGESFSATLGLFISSAARRQSSIVALAGMARVTTTICSKPSSLAKASRGSFSPSATGGRYGFALRAIALARAARFLSDVAFATCFIAVATSLA